MANSDKNIVITPNVGSASADPQIVFSGANASVGPQNITVRVYPTNNGTLSVEGSAGQLFSITNSFTGTIFSVNDVSGVPSIEVLDTGLVKVAQYSGNVLLGTGTDNGLDKLQVSGGIASTAARGVLHRAAATQDGIEIRGRAGGTSNFEVILTPGTLSADRTLTLPDVTGTVVTTGDTGSVTSTMIANGTIVDADISASAAIADTKLATISTASKVSNSATTATSANTASAIVARDANGDFSAGAVTVTSLVYGTTSISAAGTTQANATAITSDIVIITGGTGGVRLPAVTGRRIMIRNNSGSSINVYPNSGAQIESIGNNVAYLFLTGTTVELISFSATQWYFQAAIAT